MKGLSHSNIAVHHERVINLFRDNPPDLFVLEQPIQAYGIHLRRQPYICIGKYWVDQWTLAMKFDPNRRLALALDTVIRATLVHELALWISTLVSKSCHYLANTALT